MLTARTLPRILIFGDEVCYPSGSERDAGASGPSLEIPAQILLKNTVRIAKYARKAQAPLHPRLSFLVALG